VTRRSDAHLILIVENVEMAGMHALAQGAVTTARVMTY